MTNIPTRRFNEIPVICDEQTWIWELTDQALAKKEHVRIPSNAPLRASWDRFKDAERLVVYWENKGRSGGAVVEEILEIAPIYDISDRIIVLMSNPTREDIVYCSELGLTRIVRLRMRERDMEQAKIEIANHVEQTHPQQKIEAAWLKITRALSQLPTQNAMVFIEKIEAALDTLVSRAGGRGSARHYDVLAAIAHARGAHGEALKLWHKALEINPNYYRAYNNLIAFHQQQGQHKHAMQLMHKMNLLNNSRVSRIVKMGEIHAELGEDSKAEHCFKSALNRDSYCSGAMNGLAALRFKQGELDESRQLLAKSASAYHLAAKLNREGIEMVRQAKYADALTHYTKAQYVLPQQDKGPMLFYNIGLCYSRWGKVPMAESFLRLALIKDPSYAKAKKLLANLEQTASAS